MLDNPLIALIISTVIAGEASAGIPGTPVKQAFQPTNQGVNTGPTAYLHKLGDRRYGFPYWADVYDTVHSQMVHTELQQYETSFQISTLSTQDPSNVSQYTASDVANLIAHIIQSQASVMTFQANNVGIERVTEVRNPPFTDDRQRFEYSPSFDFVMTHKQILSIDVPIVNTTEFDVYPI